MAQKRARYARTEARATRLGRPIPRAPRPRAHLLEGKQVAHEVVHARGEVSLVGLERRLDISGLLVRVILVVAFLGSSSLGLRRAGKNGRRPQAVAALLVATLRPRPGQVGQQGGEGSAGRRALLV